MRNKQAFEYEAVNETIRKRDCYKVGSELWEVMDYMKADMLRTMLPEMPVNDVFVVEKTKLKKFVSEFTSDWSIDRLESATKQFRYERMIAHPKYVRLDLIVKQDNESISIVKPVELRAEAVNVDHLMKLLIKDVVTSDVQYNFDRLYYENDILNIIYKAY
ncbi:hypothetical protein ABD91_20230 [Lysinibacillus sphaericus]|uniref:hypothetical protein n=1 Tax=Lysinibacillus sphaericus TaxID=1421 RepID=UPI0018CDC140|nr:hypothetical protein [Lysinibacillus sphaericus]MBG9693080.1 hypothetical protein [Lysinibacillus sphaericus]